MDWTDRSLWSQRTVVSGLQSNLWLITNCVPVGLMLGSVRFTVFVNNLGNRTETSSANSYNNWGKQSICDILVLPSTVTLTNWSNGPTGTSWSSVKTNAKSCSWDRTALSNGIDWGVTSKRAAVLERTWASWGITSYTSHLCMLATQGHHMLNCISQSAVSRSKEVNIPLCLALIKITFWYWVQFGAFQCKKY